MILALRGREEKSFATPVETSTRQIRCVITERKCSLEYDYNFEYQCPKRFGNRVTAIGQVWIAISDDHVNTNRSISYNKNTFFSVYSLITSYFILKL